MQACCCRLAACHHTTRRPQRERGRQTRVRGSGAGAGLLSARWMRLRRAGARGPEVRRTSRNLVFSTPLQCYALLSRLPVSGDDTDR